MIRCLYNEVSFLCITQNFFRGKNFIDGEKFLKGNN